MDAWLQINTELISAGNSNLRIIAPDTFGNIVFIWADGESKSYPVADQAQTMQDLAAYTGASQFGGTSLLAISPTTGAVSTTFPLYLFGAGFDPAGTFTYTPHSTMTPVTATIVNVNSAVAYIAAFAAPASPDTFDFSYTDPLGNTVNLLSALVIS